ncbi:Unknown protein [Striga hermonthica]|uniref:F-box domain-containing protein n=1 Tax=Striga hermonthica TaxID=68872 RepID=A0A9N7N964_STRHE|nr:Unknown protein [Striga hermonthica]
MAAAGDWLTKSYSYSGRKLIITKNNWSDVPPEILSLILSQLFFKDRHNFKLVCRSWSSVVPNAPQLPPPANSRHLHSPCLIIPQSSTPSRWKIFHSLHNAFYYLDVPPQVEHAEIMFSKDGWLLMSARSDFSPMFFFNPLTWERFELPPTDEPFDSICFTSPPTTDKCFVFGIFVFGTEFGLIRLGDMQWEIGPFNRGSIQPRICPPVFHCGVYHYLGSGAPRSRDLVTFDPMRTGPARCLPKPKWTPDGNEEDDDEDYEKDHELYLAEAQGEILAVFVYNAERKLSVKRWDFGVSHWRRVQSLGGKCMYVSRNGSFVETRPCHGLENKIYLNKFFGESGVLYSMATGMYHSIEGGFASRDGYRLACNFDFATWIKLRNYSNCVATHSILAITCNPKTQTTQRHRQRPRDADAKSLVGGGDGPDKPFLQIMLMSQPKSPIPK